MSAVPKVRRPVLRYHGGKWMLAPWLIRQFPPHRIYVEPFGGAASVLMRKPRAFAEVYNDLDGEVVNVFRVLRDPASADRLTHLLRLTPWSREEFYAAYEPSDDAVERARRTIVRQFMGFGTTARRKGRTGFRAKAYRYNQTGCQDWTNYPDALTAFTARLCGVCLEHAPALDVIRAQDGPGTLFYCDPPYPAGTRSSMRTLPNDGSTAYAHELTDDDHRALAAVLHGVQGMVALSGYASDLYDRELYPTWERLERAHLADGARQRTEVLWLNPAATTARVGGLFQEVV